MRPGIAWKGISILIKLLPSPEVLLLYWFSSFKKLIKSLSKLLTFWKTSYKIERHAVIKRLVNLIKLCLINILRRSQKKVQPVEIWRSLRAIYCSVSANPSIPESPVQSMLHGKVMRNKFLKLFLRRKIWTRRSCGIPQIRIKNSQFHE